MNHLHVTNGDVAAGIMRKAGIAGDILPWRDVLHDGPVPGGLALAELSQVRARFIADCGWASYADALADFRERDAKLAAFRECREVTLWFEHDLYDQLQLLQVLDWFSSQPPGRTRLTMICIDQYLGRLSESKMASLFLTREPVTEAQRLLARKAWRAFRAPQPEDWQAMLDEDTAALPFLADAVLRHLEQFPAAGNGLNRTESRLLEAVRAGHRTPWRIFDAVALTEEREFMGDATFFLCLKALIDARPPLLATHSGAPFRLAGPHTPPEAFEEQVVRLTREGERTLDKELDWVTLGSPDRWLGGVHLTAGRVWRWDHDTLGLQAPADSIADRTPG